MGKLKKHRKGIMIGLTSLVIVVIAISIILFRFIPENVHYSKEEAQRVVLEQIPNGRIMASEVDYEIFNTYYEFTIIDENYHSYEVTFNANSGEIEEFEIDD
jgi:uncharacterized membrane protein YkoI